MIKWLQPSIVVLAIIGLMDSLYLSYARYASVDLPCGITDGGCAVVAASPYAVLFGIPLAYLGVVFYMAVLVLGLLLMFKSRIKYIKEGLLIVTIFGALDSLYFLYLQGFVIKAFCIYCIISAIITFMLVVVVYFLTKDNVLYKLLNKNKL